jgi:predicted transcriptional regulator
MDKKATFRIDETILKKLKYLAVDQDRSLTDLYLEAIKDLLKKHEKKPKK